VNVARIMSRALALSGALAAVAALPAGAAKIPAVDTTRLWATVNVCDTPKSPNKIGIRAAMPGSGVAKERMFLRLRVQFYKPSTKRWVFIGAGGDSGFQELGRSTRNREAGLTFGVSSPAAGQSYRVRGLVSYEWRRGTRVVRRATRATRAGHPNTIDADPADYSAAECTITTPPPGTTTSP
jgi:hypothetical protein